MHWTIIADDKVTPSFVIQGEGDERAVRLWLPAGRRSSAADTKGIMEIQAPEPRKFDEPTADEIKEGLAWLQAN